MPVIVVGGTGRGVGKTALVCGLIAEYLTFRWTAVKISTHLHSKPEPIREEVQRGQGTDTERYLAAGARRALLVTAPGEEFPLRAMQAAIGPAANVIFESNRILAHWQPDVCIGILGGSGDDFKLSFEAFWGRADAFVIARSTDTSLLHLTAGTRVFRLDEPNRLSPEMRTWLEAKITPPQQP
ncbi:MAG: hypothetical protein WBV28_09280 [Terracidiphilus sp.]